VGNLKRDFIEAADVLVVAKVFDATGRRRVPDIFCGFSRSLAFASQHL
jgi:hypothetical protein